MTFAKERSKKLKLTQGGAAQRRELSNAISELRKLKKSEAVASGNMSVFVSENSVIVRRHQAREPISQKSAIGRITNGRVILGSRVKSEAEQVEKSSADRSRDTAYFEQMSKLIKCSALDNKKAVDTLRSSPSEEALAFYGMLSKR